MTTLLLLVGLAAASPAGHADRIADRARAHLDHGRLFEAFQTAARALERDPANVQAHATRGQAGLMLAEQLPDDLAEAIIGIARDDLTYVVANSPDAFERGLARGALQVGQTPLVPTPQVTCPEEATAAFAAGEAALDHRDFAAARVAYDAALGACPGNAAWWESTGDAWFNAGDYAVAREKYNRALQIDPCDWTALRFRGDALLREGRVSEGMDDVLAAVSCNPTYEVGWGYLESLAQIAGGSMVRQPVVRPAAGEAGALEPVWAAYRAVRAGEGADALDVERRAVRAALVVWRALPPDARNDALWQAMDAAETDGVLDPAVLVWLLDGQLAQAFLDYRAAHLTEVVAYVRSHLVQFPAE